MSYGLPVFRTPQVILFSSDLPRAAAFYTGLGFTETSRTPADGEASQAAPASAEAVRSTMSAMQRGWELGRTASSGPPDAAGPDAASGELSAADQDGQ